MSVNYKVLLVFFSVIKFLVVILTLFRLGFRLKIQRFWWEDMWAAVTLLCTVVSIIAVFVVYGASKCLQSYNPEVGTKISAYMFTSIVWSVRMSLIFSIVRITPSIFRRRITLGVAACFLLFWATTLGLYARWCGEDTQTPSGEALLFCVLPRPVVIFEMATNCTADAATAIFPLNLLWRVKLPKRQRRMFLSIFSASRFLCAFSLARLIVELVGLQRVQAVLADMQLSIFLIACNLLVAVTYVYRVFLSASEEALPPGSSTDDDDDDDFTTPAPRSRTTSNLTTVDPTSPWASISNITSEHKSFPSAFER